MRMYSALAVPVLLLSVSCTNSGQMEKHFDVVKEIKAEQVFISEILNPNNIIKLEDYIVLQNAVDAAVDVYYVYSCPELEFLYSFAHHGRGPEEYLMPSVIKNTSGNILGFKDHATDKVAFYGLSDTAAELVGDSKFQSPDYDRFFWEINLIDDSLFLVKHQGYKRGNKELWSLKSGLKDCMPNTFKKLPDKLGDNYYTIFDDYLISANGDRFAIAYNFIDRIEIGEVRDGKIKIETALGAKRPPKFHLYGDDTETEFSVDRNIVRYENLYAGEHCIYALYSGARLDDTEKNHSSVIEVYSWDGKPVQLLKLSTAVAYFAVDEKSRTIYGVNPEQSPDVILKFKY